MFNLFFIVLLSLGVAGLVAYFAKDAKDTTSIYDAP